MGIYGVSVYGQSKFGYDAGQISPPGFSAYPFTSDPVSYDSQFLNWTRPQSNYCSRLRLVRNHYNTPADASDGLVLFDQPNSMPVTFLDSGLAVGFTYYSIFGFDTNPIDPNFNTWIRCADLIVLTPNQWSYGSAYYNLLPEFYRNRDYLLVDNTNPDPAQQTLNPPLQRYLNLLGFQMDIIRSEIDSLLLVNDPLNCSGNLLPLLASQVGLVYEHEMGMKQARELIANAVHLYKRKGTSAGISEFVSTLTGYPVASVVLGPNRLPYNDDSDGTASTGSWVLNVGTDSASTTITNQNLTTLYSISPTAIATNLGILPSSEGVFYNGSAIQIKAGVVGTCSIKSGLMPMSDFVNSNGTGAFNFTLQFYTPNAFTARSVILRIYDDSNTQLATSTTLSVKNGMKTMSVTGTLTNPTGNFLYAVITVASMGINELQFFTLAGVYNVNPLPAVIPPQTLFFDYPRNLLITIDPIDANLFGNPLTTFYNGIDGWTSDLVPTKSYTVTGTTNSSNPGVVTVSVPHGFSVGQSITIAGVLGTTEANGSWVISTVPSATTFTIPIGFTHAWVSGGIVTGPQTMNFSIQYVELGDLSETFGVFGVGSLQVTSLGGANPVIYGGEVNSIVSQPVQAGWSPEWTVGAGDWFGGATTTYTGMKIWFGSDAGYGGYAQNYGNSSAQWFFDNNGFFASNSNGVSPGDWFEQAPWVQDFHGLPLPIIPQPNTFYTFSVYLAMGGGSGNGTMQPGFYWIMADGTTRINTSVPTVSPTIGSFSRYVVQCETPNDALGNPAVGLLGMISFPGALAGDSFRVNAAMMDPTLPVTPYFDFYLNPGNPDYQAGVHGGSFYYPHQEQKAARLNQLLPSWVPMGATYSLIFSEPGG